MIGLPDDGVEIKEIFFITMRIFTKAFPATRSTLSCLLGGSMALAGLATTAVPARSADAMPSAAALPTVSDPALTPRQGVYVQVRDGHLSYGGRRLKLWGVNGHYVTSWTAGGRTEQDSDFDAARVRSLGFNAFRLWGCHDFTDPQSSKRGEFRTYTKGDGSDFDYYDRYFAALKKNGLFVWITAPHYDPLGFDTKNRSALLEDGSFLEPGPDWAAWRDAVGENSFNNEHVWLGWEAKFFDERLQRLVKRQTADFLNHVNPYTGKRYAEDEAIATLSFDNEDAMPFYVLAWNDFQKWPHYFQNEALQQWNEWLKAKYRDDAHLLAAYGKLDAGESLGSIGFHPLYGEKSTYPAARAADLMEFLVDRCTRYYDDLRESVRSLAPAGVGCNVVPLVYDTQYSSNFLWQAIEGHGDIYSSSYYSTTLRSLLSAPPNEKQMEGSRLADKPTVIYEGNAGRPNPYRAEFPLRLGTLAAWQDFDGVFMHIWGSTGRNSDGQGVWLSAPMPYPLPTGHTWDGVGAENDPVMLASYYLAGQIFLRGSVHPAPTPQIVNVGNDALYNYDNWRGVDVRDLAYSRGARLQFTGKPGGIEPALAAAAPNDQPVKSGDQILWDWPNGRLIVDAPDAKLYVGRTAGSYRFSDGTVLSGMNTPFVAWGMVSSDGAPLTGKNATRSAIVLAQSDARNTDFRLSPPIDASSLIDIPAGKIGKYVDDGGHAPVVKDKVGFTLSLPNRLNGRFTSYDFGLKPSGAQELANTNTLTVAPSDSWMGVLSIDTRGAAADPVIAPEVKTDIGGAGPSSAAPTVTSAGLRNPVLGLDWGMSYAQAYHALRPSGNTSGAARIYSRMSPEDTSDNVAKIITLNNVSVIPQTPSDITITFASNHMNQITATFTQAIDWPSAVAYLTGQYGAPSENTHMLAASDESVARWLVPGKDGAPLLSIELLEQQGTAALTFRLRQ
jgi:hypothetical protein